MTTSSGPLGRYSGESPAEQALVRVELRNLPLAVLVASREHHDELMREFRLMALSGTVPDAAAPARLLELVQVLGVQYAGTSERPSAEIDVALDAGQDVLDLVYDVPASVAEAATALDALMRDADEFCRAERLLTLARTPLMVDFAAWYLRCFVDQIAGGPPEPWTGPLTP